MKKLVTLSFLTCIFSLAIFSIANAQVAFGFGYNYTKPLQEYNENLEKDPKGVSINVLYNPAKLKNVYVGAEVGVSMYANDSYYLALRDSEGNDLTAEIDEEDCFFSYNALLRYFPSKDKLVNPYIESRIGAISFFSTSMAEEGFQDLYDSKTAFHGTALNFGIGGGAVFDISYNLAIDVNATFNRGQHTFYRSIEESDINYRRNLDYGRHESKTNNLNFKIGILFGF